MSRRVEAALERLEGVHWAEVNAVTGRVVVAFDGDALALDDLVEVVDGVEEAHDVHGERFPHDRAEHPGDVEPLHRNLVALGADVAGIGVSVFGQLLRATPVPAELATVVSLLDTQPRVRRVFVDYFGHPATDLGFALATAFANALSQGPLGLLVDATNRATLIGELNARQHNWAAREPELLGHRNDALDLDDVGERPRPLPAGPVEAYADRASLASFGAFGVTLAATRDPRRASNALLAGLPKAARLGREAYAAQLGRTLAGRGVVVMDDAVLRRLDRITAVVIDSRNLETGASELGELVAVGATDAAELTRWVYALFDPDKPEATRRKGIWGLVPVESLTDVPSGPARATARRLREGRASVLGLRRRGELVALVRVEPQLDPLATTLARCVRSAGFELIVAGRRGRTDVRLGADRVVPGGSKLAASVRALQSEGLGVALVSSRPPTALAAADCGIGVIGADGHAPWAADVICGPGLEQVCFVLTAAATGRSASRTSVMLAMAGSGIGGVWAMAGPTRGAASRALVPVNVAALAAQAAGTWSGATLSRRPLALPVEPLPWHSLDAPTVVAALGSKLSGLPSDEAAHRRKPDDAGGMDKPSLSRAVMAELVNPLTPVLAMGALISAAVGSVTDAALVGTVVSANAVVSGLQRFQTDRSLERLLRLSVTTVRVRRDGVLVELPVAELVPGDIVELDGGDLVPADCRIIETNGCEVDEANLTGESLAVTKTALPTPTRVIADRSCMLYDGTTMATGHATAIVVATGSSTEAGRSLAAAADPPPSGVEARLSRLTAITVPVTIASGAAVTALGLMWRRPVRDAIASGVSLTVAAVPEGLPLLATVAQQAAAHRLSERGALVRNPRTIETLGRVDVLCFDKTGTLTQGRIGLQRVSDGDHDDLLESLGPSRRDVLAAALRASPDEDPDNALLHATDQAIVDGGATAHVSATDGVGDWQPLFELAFESGRGYHAVLGTTPAGARLSVKGAPEVILPRCQRWRGSDDHKDDDHNDRDHKDRGHKELDKRTRRRLYAEVERLAAQGLRVLAVAERVTCESVDVTDEHVSDLELVGFVALADLVRPTAAVAVNKLRSAGVDVAMITGDHPTTAAAIALELGILNGGRVLSGPQLEDLSDPDLDEALTKTTVFARITPAQKVRIVEAYQRAGRVVAMTGDGANDAAAIRLAHAGVALGQRCAPAAREAADLVVLDDRIETIIDAIVEGRAMWASVRDALGILLGGNLGEVGFDLAATALTGRAPLNTRQLLLVNLLTDMLPAMAIVLRPPRGVDPEALLHEGPEASLGSALVRDVALRATATAGGATGAWLVARATGTPTRARTVGLVALVSTQLGQTAVVGGRSPLVLGASAASLAVLAAIVQTPGVSQFFGCTPIDPLAWATALGSAGIATGGAVAVPWLITQLTQKQGG